MAKNNLTDSDKREICKTYNDGNTTTSIAKQFKVAPQAISEILTNFGVDIRGPKARSVNCSEDNKQYIIDLWQQGYSRWYIYRNLGISGHIVERVIKEAGFIIENRTPTGSERHNYKGGHITPYGYKMVTLPKGNSYEDMATSKKGTYFFEHRLIMAQHLGRSLFSYETVHHINGNKLDNRIENLQLRTSNHSQGSVAYCGDCGSVDISYKGLS